MIARSRMNMKPRDMATRCNRFWEANSLLIWDIFVVISIIPSTFFVTYQAVYNASVVWQWIIIYIADIIYIFSMVVRFFRSYVHKGEIISDRQSIVIHYLQTTFLCDFFSILPFEIFAIPEYINGGEFMMALLRLNRFVRLYRVWEFLYDQEKKLGTNTSLFMCLRFIFLGSVSLHFIAGFWFAIACNNTSLVKLGQQICRSDSWARHQNINWRTIAEYEKYIITLYWAVTTCTTVGYGDITPKTPEEKWLSLACMLFGVILFSYILGDWAAMITNADAQRTSFIHRLDAIKRQLVDAEISETLKNRVIGYYEYLWKKNRGKSVSELYNEFPVALQAEFSLDCYKGILEKVPLFEDCPEEFIRLLSLLVKHVLYLPHQVIITEGDTGHEIYIIHLGEAEVFDDIDSPPITLLTEGDIYGEENLIQSAPFTKTVKARTHCDLLIIPVKELLNILQYFPDLKDHIKEMIEQKSVLETDLMDSFVGHDSRFQRKIRRPRQFQRFLDCLNYPLMAGSRFIILWDLFVAFIAIIICWLYTYEAAFTHYKPEVGYGNGIGGRLLFAFTYLLESVIILDIIISMKRAVATPSELVASSSVMFMEYVTSVWFVLDVLAVLPLELFSLFWLGSGKVWKYIPLFKLNRLLKLWKVFAFFRDIEISLHISITYVSLLKFGISITTVTHVCACVWFPIACFYENNCLSSSWAKVHGVTEHTSPWQDYVISVYWAAATLTTVGYGEISAYNTQEMIISLIVQITGIVLYGYCLGVVAASLTNVALPRVSFQEKMEAVHQFMSDHNLGKGLMERVDHYFTLIWEQYRGEAFPGELNLMYDLPQNVQEDVCMEGYGALLREIPFLAHTTEYLRQISVSTSIYNFSRGDIVCYDGEMGQEMYIVRKGLVEILSEDLHHVIAALGPGKYFGEIEFLFGVPRQYTVRAATNCQLLMLDRKECDEILHDFPDTKRNLEIIASNETYLRTAIDIVANANKIAMRKPKQFPCPSVTSALAVAMATTISPIVRSSLSSTVAGCVGGLDAQRKVMGPISIGVEHHSGTIARYKDPKYDEKSHRKYRQGPSSQEEVEIDYRSSDSSLQQCISCSLSPYTLLPNSRFIYCWKILTFVLIYIMIITVSLQAAFAHQEIALWAINYLLDLFFIIDIILKMRTAYYNKKGILITEPGDCAAHYFKSKFCMDFISSLPTDIIALCAWTYIGDILRILALVRVNRLIRACELPAFFNIVERKITRSLAPIKQIKFAVYMSLATHLITCMWFLIACSALVIEPYDPHICNVKSWALHVPIKQYSETALSNASFNIAHQYIVSLYWAVATTTTVGYGDIRAHTHLERIYAVLIMIFGVMSYGYIIASIAASLTNYDSGRSHYQTKLKNIKSYLKEYGVSPSLIKRVVRYYEFIWKQKKGVSFGPLFHGMPVALRADTSISLYKSIIDQVSLFSNTDLGFTKLLALSIKPVFFLKNEYIVRKGDIGNEMFFIHRGLVEVVINEDGNDVISTLGKGEFFGEISLIFSCPRTSSVRAATNCDMFVLTKTDLDYALSYYPELEEQICAVAEERMNQAYKRSQEPRRRRKIPPQSSDLETRGAVLDDFLSTLEEMTLEKDRKNRRDLRRRIPRFVMFCMGLWMLTKRCFKTAIHREGLFGSFIYWTGCLLAYFSFFTISYQAAFQDPSIGLLCVNISFEVYFLIELLLKFHFTYEDKNGHTISDFKKTATHYATDPKGLLLDFVTLFPYELFALPIPNYSQRIAALLYMRLPHLIRVIRITWLFAAEQKKLNQRAFLLQMTKSFVLISLYVHSVACIWYFLACRAGTCSTNSWAEAASLLDKRTSPNHYGTSLYWAITTMTTVGYGDISATNVVEMVYAIVVMVLGKILFAFVLGTIASTFINLETERLLYEDKVNAMRQYMKNKHLSLVMRQRVFNFLNYLWLRNKGTGRQDILSDLPYCMQAEVSLAITNTMLRQVIIFKDVDEAFLRHIALILKPYLFLPGDFIVHKGDVGHGIYFIYHGAVAVVDDENLYEVKEYLFQGGSFGLEALLFLVPTKSTVRALTHVDVFSFTAAEFSAVLRAHPDAMKKIQEIAVKKYNLPIQFLPMYM